MKLLEDFTFRRCPSSLYPNLKDRLLTSKRRHWRGYQGKAEFLHPVIRTPPVGLSLIHEQDLDV